ncbi:MAG: hypothetical protein ACLQLG_18620 [Thermoguttaceae bacterium]
MPPAFDDLFAAADQSLDELYAVPAGYRPGGNVQQQFAVTASVSALGEDTDQASDRGPETDIQYVVTLYVSDLVLDGQAWPVTGGDEIAFPLPDGSTQVCKVVSGPKGRPSEPLDTINYKLIAYAKLIRTETA